MKDDRVYLQHIREALQDIAAYCGSDHGAFLDDRMRQDATLRKLEVIGQAVKNLSEDAKSRQPEIPWKQIAGMRDKVIHDYFGVNLEIVWAVVQKELPKLRVAVEGLPAPPSSSPKDRSTGFTTPTDPVGWHRAAG